MADRSVVYRLRADIAGFRAQMAAAGASVKDAGNKMTAASKEGEKFRKGLDSAGKAAGTLGLAAGAALGVAVAKAADFDSAMSRIDAATHETAKNMGLLREAALKAGADTVFSATEAADAITALAKAGVSTNDVLNGGLNGALALASAGELDVAQAAEIAATAMTQFGLSGKDVPHIADLLAAGAGKAQGEVTDMAQALKYVGPVAHQMGISIEQTAGTIAYLASQGVLADQAGTSLRGMLSSLTSPSKIAADQMSALGINVYNAQGAFVGFDGVAEQLRQRLGNLTNAERDQALGRIFGNEQITTARILYAGGAKAIDQWTTSVNDQGYAADTARRKLDNLKGDLEQLSGAFQTALIGTGEGSQGPLRKLTQNLTDAVNKYNELPQAAKSATTETLGLVAAIGGSIFVFSKVVKGVASTRGALDELGVSAGRVGQTIRTGLAVGAVLEGLQLLDQGLDSIFDKNLDQSNLSRSLNALAAGRVTGEIKDKFGGDLKAFGDQAFYATSSVTGLSRAVNKIPLVGGFLSGDFLQHDTETATQNIKSLDEALANMVEGGQQAQAAAVFDQLEKSAKAAGVSTKDLNGLFGQYRVAIGNVKTETDGSTNATKQATAAQLGLTEASGEALKMTQEQAKALEEARKAATDEADAFGGLGESVNKTKVTLTGWIDELNKQTAALNEFTTNTRRAAKRGLEEGLIAALRAAGPEGALRMKQLANATDAEIRKANRAWRSGQRAIDRYVDSVVKVPPSKTTTLFLNLKETAEAHKIISPQIKRAEGGTVPGQRAPYGDKVLAYLAPGEEVITNRDGQADRYRSILRAINNNSYASGGTVGGGSPIGPSIDYDRLAAAMAAVRPLYGDVHNYGGMDEWRRMTQADTRRASGGIRGSVR